MKLDANPKTPTDDVIEPLAANRRVSITKTQRATAIGAELLSLCQTATSDGSLADEEVIDLRSWLDANRTTDLPAVQYLSPIVERILADGRVESEERRDLFLAIEKILPVDVREMSRTARQSKEKVVADEQRALAAAGKQRQQEIKREERERNRPPHYFDFMFAGAKHNGRPAVIDRHVDDEDQVLLERDTGNAHSRNAVRILTTSRKEIGFVPEEDAKSMAPLLDAGHDYSASVKKILQGSTHNIPVVVARVARHPEGHVSRENAARRSPESSRNSSQAPASTNSLPYLLGKFARRYWWLMAIAALAFAFFR